MRIDDRSRIGRARPVTRVRRRLVTTEADENLTYHCEGQTWSFENNRILLEGYDINDLISDSEEREEPAVSTLVGVASGLSVYKEWARSRTRRPLQTGKLMAMADALIEKVFGKVKKIYDDKMYGVSWRLKDNDLIINGVNVSSFLVLFRIRPTEKARKFLKGLQAKVDMLLSNPSGNVANERAYNKIMTLKREIDEELAKEYPASNLLLHSGDHSGG